MQGHAEQVRNGVKWRLRVGRIVMLYSDNGTDWMLIFVNILTRIHLTGLSLFIPSLQLLLFYKCWVYFCILFYLKEKNCAHSALIGLLCFCNRFCFSTPRQVRVRWAGTWPVYGQVGRSDQEP